MDFIHGVVATIVMTAFCAFIIGLVYVAELVRIGAY